MKRSGVIALASVLSLGCAGSPSTTPCGPDIDWLDRVEGDRAVLVASDGATRSVPVASIPDGVGEGEALRGGQAAPACTEWMRRDVRQRRERLLGQRDRAPP